MMRTISRLPHALLALLCLVSPLPLMQAAEPTPFQPEFAVPVFRPDFSGSWEKDFARSENWENKLREQLEQMRRNAERGYNSDLSGPPASLRSGNSGRRGGASLVELAQLTGHINRQSTLRITQSATEIRIERRFDSDLVCAIRDHTTAVFVDRVGEEICGWDGHQLLFSIMLPEGVEILHRYTVDPEREWLYVATTTSSRSASFTQLQFFRRYESPNDEYQCIETISRGNACSLGGSLQYD